MKNKELFFQFVTVFCAIDEIDFCNNYSSFFIFLAHNAKTLSHVSFARQAKKTSYRARVVIMATAVEDEFPSRDSFIFLPSIMRNASFQTRRGFTLIELLLVIGIIAILASIVIVAINPTKQLGDARDAQRRSDVNTVLNAVYQYAIDNNGNLPTGIPTTTAREICTTNSTDCDATVAVDLDVLTGSYLVRLPIDPSAPTTATGTDYFIVQDANGRITVSAPEAEQSTSISVTR